jgi:L,D-transpeptidase ErfK/SrfK
MREISVEKIRSALVTLVIKGPRSRLWTLATSALALILAGVLLVATRSTSKPHIAIPPDVARLDPATLRKQVITVDAKVRSLTERRDRLFPSGPAILVDSATNQITLLQGGKVVAQDKCSTGSGLALTDASGKRTWTFETPRGHFAALSKVTNPVWVRPDWAFVEEGTAIPRDRASRAVSNVLGDYAIAFGDGYFIHGTLYTRMLGSNVTHGCVRVDDETLEKLYRAARHGTPIWIY